MALTSLNGATLIRAGTIPWAQMVPGAIVPLASIIGGTTLLNSAGTVAMTAALNLGGYTAQNSGAPSNATDLANKAYVDAKTGGIGGIHDVRALANINITLTAPGSSIDSVALNAGDNVVLVAQTTASQNGPWVWNGTSSTMTRPSWWASTTNVNEGQYFMVAEGSVYKDTKWWCTTVGTITVDTTSTSYAQDLTGQIYTNGTGLALAGGQFSVNYGTTAGTAAQGNDARITGALQTSALATGVQTALGVAVGSIGGPVINGGTLGTPSSGTLSSCSGLPLSGLTGFGTGVLGALAVAVGSAGSPVINGGTLGTPSGGTLSACGGLPLSTGITGFGTGVAAALAFATNTAGGVPTLATGGYLAAANFPAISGDVIIANGTLAATVNNTSSSGFTKYTNYINGETPAGTLNGVNATFTLAHTPANCYAGVNSLELYNDGVLMQSGAGNDYTISGTTITMLSGAIPGSADKLVASYMI